MKSGLDAKPLFLSFPLLIDCIWQNNKKCKNMVPNSNLLEGPNVSSKLTSVALKTHGVN